MRIVADANIPVLADLFSPVCEFQQIDGRRIESAMLRDADALIVRSITPVNEALLAESSVRVVATATSGVDHIDVDWLSSQGIKLVSAAGENAQAVADYVTAALAHLVEPFQIGKSGMKCGVIGVGHVGTEVARRLLALGCEVLLCDPPRDDVGDTSALGRFVSMEEMSGCDLITLHTPLIQDGIHPTYQFIETGFLHSLPAQAILINTSRGEVIDEAALISAVRARKDLQVVLDVFDDEPQVSLKFRALAISCYMWRG